MTQSADSTAWRPPNSKPLDGAPIFFLFWRYRTAPAAMNARGATPSERLNMVENALALS